MRTNINDFAPNSGGRRAAEVLVGMQGFGVVTEWFEDDDGFHVTYRLTDEETVDEVMTARDIVTFSHGVLAAVFAFKPERVIP